MKLFSIQLDKLLSPHYWKHLYKKRSDFKDVSEFNENSVSQNMEN